MKKGWVCLVSLAAVAATTTAEAYIPPSQYIVRQMVTKRGSFKALRIRGTVMAMEGDRPTGPRFRQVTVFDAGSRVMRSRAFDESGRELYSMERKLAPSGQAVREADVSSAAGSILIEPSSEALRGLLKAAGVPVRSESELLEMKDEEERRASEVTSLGRWKGVVSWLIGPERKEAYQPQLWVEKDTFLPIRMIVKADEGKFDVRYSGYRYFRDFPYPKTIAVAKPNPANDNDVVMLDDLSEVIVNPEGGDFKGAAAQGFTDAGNSADSATRDLIRLYYRVIR